jgi:hypothetical protein
METPSVRQHLIAQLTVVSKKGKLRLPGDLSTVSWETLQKVVQEELDELKWKARIGQYLVYVMLPLTGVFSMIRVLDLASWPDLNKGALTILLTVTFSLQFIFLKSRMMRLEKQVLLLDTLGKIDSGIRIS